MEEGTGTLPETLMSCPDQDRRNKLTGHEIDDTLLFSGNKDQGKVREEIS